MISNIEIINLTYPKCSGSLQFMFALYICAITLQAFLKTILLNVGSSMAMFGTRSAGTTYDDHDSHPSDSHPSDSHPSDSHPSGGSAISSARAWPRPGM
jgi:hypothetical protein